MKNGGLKIPNRERESGPQPGSPVREPLDPIRFIPFYVFIALAILGLGARLIYLQVFRGAEYDALAQENREQKINIPAARGVIYDRNNVLLARNVPSYNVTITPAYLPDDEIRLSDIYKYIADETGVPIDTPPLDAGIKCGPTTTPCGIRQLVTDNEGFPYVPITVAKDVKQEVAFEIRGRLRGLPGVGIEVVPLRDYPTGSLTAHVVGYMGPITEQVVEEYEALGFDASRDKIGYAGIEAWDQNTLAGANGYKFIEEDAAGLELRTIGEPVNPTPGRNIVLTLDVRLQAAAEAALKRMIEDINRVANSTKTQNGVVIAMNPKTGEILAMISWPAYDNQKFARFIPFEYYETLRKDVANPLLNQAISGRHAPGSVFKTVLAAGALQEGVIDPARELFDPGKIVIENRYFPNDPGQAKEVVCWKRTGHGDIDMVNAIAQSCSVYFYMIGGGFAPDNVTGIDIEGIYKYANMFGYNRLTGVELPGERRGLIPDRDFKRINIGENWSTGDTYIASIGQGYVLSTPLQVLNSVTPFINNGWLIKPTLIKEVRDGEGNIIAPFQINYLDGNPDTQDVYDNDNPESLPLSAATINIVRQGMQEVYISGTAFIAELLPIEVPIAPNSEQLVQIPAAGKSGTAEYCDNIAQKKDLCKFGRWPTHGWFVGYAPADNPEIAVVAFIYNGGEGSLVAGPVVQQVMQAYFDLKNVDISREQSGQ